MAIILNTTQHKLPAKFVEKVDTDGVSFVMELRDVDPELFDRLSNCPFDRGLLAKLADDFIRLLCEYPYQDGYVVVFPIGSPAFNAILWTRIACTPSMSDVSINFLHSRRIVSDDGNGKKIVTFKYDGYITL
ncbi:MAG: hypothetical protein CUN57_00915 [Phototrophicales bacterium]|nr:MAG: hypothetical protein CUN57_00915 [Phototrophicales bacterium]